MEKESGSFCMERIATKTEKDEYLLKDREGKGMEEGGGDGALLTGWEHSAHIAQHHPAYYDDQ